MPQPKPKSGETKSEWDDRCMSDDVMTSEYDDQDQRYAVCQSIWDEAKETKSTMNPRTEWRHFFAEELRTIEESDGSRRIIGYPAMFNKLSEDLGGFQEKIAPGAFRSTLKNGADVRALWNHDMNYVLGRTKSGTLKLKEDNKGLYMENKPPDTQWARDLMVSIGREDVTQMSFGFLVHDEEWKERKDKSPVRTIKDVELIDVSVVTFPAYPDTSVALRSKEKWQKDPDEKKITITDREDTFVFRDRDQLQRILQHIFEYDREFIEKFAEKLSFLADNTEFSINADAKSKQEQSEAAPSRAEGDNGSAPTRSADVVKLMNKRLRKSDAKTIQTSPSKTES